MRFYSHINEFKERGWQLVPAMILTSDTTTLWAPSGRLIAEAHASGRSKFGPDDYVKLVEGGALKILGRRASFDPRAREKFVTTIGPSAAWLEPFDNRIAEIAEADARKPEAARRVRVLDPGIGGDWATSQIKESSPAAEVAKTSVLDGKLPPAVDERIARLRGDAGASAGMANLVHYALTTAKNNEDAFSAADANVEVAPSKHPDALAAIAGRPAFAPASVKLPSSDQLDDTLALVGTLTAPRSAEELLELWQTHRTWAGEIDALFHAEISARLKLRGEIEAGFDDRSLIEDYLGRSRLRQLWAMSGIVAEIAGLGGESHLGLAVTLLSLLPVPEVLEHTGMTQTTAYKGPTWPFALAYNTQKPSRTQVKELSTWLARLTTNDPPKGFR